HVAVNLYRTAKNAGFDVIVVDDRELYANRERFSDAKEVIVEDFDHAMARFLGMIGSKRKAITISRELIKEGIPEHLFSQVHSPVGLDIGAITPEEIG